MIRFYAELEDQMASFYKRLANDKRYESGKDVFLTLAKENQKHKQLVERVYREVITDALEACFAFTMDERNYRLETEVDENAEYNDMIKNAIEFVYKSFQGTKVKIEVENPSKKLLVKANHLILDLFENILTNAVKHNNVHLVY